ncbi:MAG: GH3 auxin-responsive promoter family protein [Dehalococcoidia bacterium]
MNEAWIFYQERGAQALWDRCLGYQTMGVERAMAMQHRLLNEHLTGFGTATLGRYLLRDQRPSNYAELTEAVPLTEYEYYADTLGERREELLDAPPKAWVRTSGRTTGKHRWHPLSVRAFEEMKWPGMGLMLASMADEPGQVRMRRGDRILNMMAPPPYASGTMFRLVEEAWPVRMFPESSQENDDLPFDVRAAKAFSSAVTEGIDFAVSLGSVLAGIGESFATRRAPGSIFSKMKNVRAFSRMGSAALRARVAGRPMYPRDAWNLRGLATGGMDSSLFRERIREYWGRYPLEVFASTEGGIIAAQSWDYTTLTLIPSLNFFEFVAEDELAREMETPGYAPRTVLMDQLEAGKNYELVITNLHGGPLMRYRTGDIMRVTGLTNSTTGANLPQVVHYSRRTDLLEIGAFVRLTEQSIWRAVEQSGVPYVDWTVRKEVEGNEPVLHLRIEPRPDSAIPAEEARARINTQLGLVESDWADMAEIAGLNPLRVTYLPRGTFDRYAQRKQSEGADLAHLKPVHMNPSEAVIDTLLEVAQAAEASPPEVRA